MRININGSLNLSPDTFIRTRAPSTAPTTDPSATGAAIEVRSRHAGNRHLHSRLRGRRSRRDGAHRQVRRPTCARCVGRAMRSRSPYNWTFYRPLCSCGINDCRRATLATSAITLVPATRRCPRASTCRSRTTRSRMQGSFPGSAGSTRSWQSNSQAGRQQRLLAAVASAPAI